MKQESTQEKTATQKLLWTIERLAPEDKANLREYFERGQASLDELILATKKKAPKGWETV